MVPQEIPNDPRDAASCWQALEQLLLGGEDWLVDRFFHYAVLHGFSRYTSTLREAWRMTAAGLTGSLIEALAAWQDVPELRPDESYETDPSSAFGLLEARRHRERGVSLPMFLGLLKYFRQAYQDLLAERGAALPEPARCRLFLERAFDRFELGFLVGWTALGRDELLAELQASNRRLANEKNKYLTLFESFSCPALYVSAAGCLENLNHQAALTFLGEQDPGTHYYREGGLQAHLPWLVPWLRRFEDTSDDELGFEVVLGTTAGRRRFEGRMRRMLDESRKFVGSVVILNDVTAREDARLQLQQAHDQLELRIEARTAELRATADRLRAEMAERQRAEDEREATQAQLLHAQKLEAIGTLAGGVAHDLNNLLQIILGNTEIITFRLGGDADLMGLASQVLHATERSAALVRQLLLFSRKQPMSFQVVALSDLCRDMTRMLGRLLGEPIRLVTELDEQLPPVHADPGSLEQVLMNLLVNARDALPRGGSILVRTSAVTFSEYDRGFPGVEPGRFACLSVQDDGIGMDAATRERIFEPFFTTKPVGHGTGLGLAVVYGIVQRHGGWINVYSEPGVGSAFRVYLPVLPDGAPELAQAPASLDTLRGAGQRILLVEDEPGVLEFSAEVLAQSGYQVRPCGDALQALAAVEAGEGPFDLVFTDVVLPDFSGPELLRRLRQVRPGQRALFASGYSTSEAEAAMRDLGDPLLSKPFGIRQLLEAVKGAIEQV